MHNAVSPPRWFAGCAGRGSRRIGPADAFAINCSGERRRITTWPPAPLPEQIRTLFGRRRTLAIGAAFGVISVLGPKAAGMVEVTTFRRDAAYSDGRHPDSVTFSSAEEDASRRDFTINGLFYDPVEQRVIDFVGGQSDLAERRLRAIGCARDRFTEDKLRMLRAVRFAAAFDFVIDAEARAAIAEMAAEIRVVSPERIAMEMRRLLTDARRAAGVRLLLETGLAAELLPEIVPRDDAGQARLDRALELLARLPGDVTFPLALAALLLPMVDADGAAAVCSRWRLSNKETDRIGWLVEHHASLNDAATMRWSALQPLLVAESIGDLLVIVEAVIAVGLRNGRALPPASVAAARDTRSPAVADRRRSVGRRDSCRPLLPNALRPHTHHPIGRRNSHEGRGAGDRAEVEGWPALTPQGVVRAEPGSGLVAGKRHDWRNGQVM